MSTNSDGEPGNAADAGHLNNSRCVGSSDCLQRWTALCGLLLLGATNPLWLPLASNEFPKIPLLGFAQTWPTLVDTGLAIVLIVCLGVITLLSRSPAAVKGLIVLTGLTLVMLDQQRLQPWMYQLIVFFTVFLIAQKEHALRGLRWLIISVYAYSAIGKLDFQFVHSVGRDFLDAGLGLFGATAEQWSPATVSCVVLMLPALELALAVGLALPKLRRFFAYSACLFHVGLIVIFSPWGLGHSWGVILWNLQFAVQAIVLFGGREGVMPESSESQRDQEKKSLGTNVAIGLISTCIVLPITERFGIWDHWPSWALYAPHSSRVQVLVAKTALDRLPDSLQTQLDNEAEPPATDVETLWVPVPLNAWCLSETMTPIYPQARFGFAVSRYLAEHLDSEFELRVRTLSVSNRLNGKRRSRDYEGKTQLSRGAEAFWLNTEPRRDSSME